MPLKTYTETFTKKAGLLPSTKQICNVISNLLLPSVIAGFPGPWSQFKGDISLGKVSEHSAILHP